MDPGRVALAATIALCIGYAGAGEPQRETGNLQMTERHGVSMERFHPAGRPWAIGTLVGHA